MDSKKALKEQLYKVLERDYIQNVGLLLYDMAKGFLEENHLENSVYLDESVLEFCLLDIMIDLARIKPFHDIKNLNLFKVMAYSASWWIRRKPFQLKQQREKDCVYVNERFALTLLFHALGFSVDHKSYEKEKREKLQECLNQLNYHLRFRNTNPQTLELLLVGVDTGNMIYDG